MRLPGLPPLAPSADVAALVGDDAFVPRGRRLGD